MHWHVADQLIHKRLPPRAALFRLGALNTMDEFDDGHHREANLDFAVVCFELFQYLPDSVASPLTGNHDAGIED